MIISLNVGDEIFIWKILRGQRRNFNVKKNSNDTAQ